MVLDDCCLLNGTENMIAGYPVGSDITVMNTIYQFPTKDTVTGKWLDDFLVMVYKDNETGEKKHQFIYKPDYKFYFLNDGTPVPDHPLLFIEKEKVHPVCAPYRDLEKTIAELTDNMDFYKYNVSNRNRRENKKLHVDTRVFYSDVNIEDHYRFEFSKQYKNTIGKLHKAYYDIECDTRYMAGEFVMSGECPINMISLMDDKFGTVITFILRNDKNPQIQELEDNINKGVINEKYIRDFVTKAVGGYKQSVRLKVDKLKYRQLFFTNELDMIAAFFKAVHSMNPDFIMGWNSSSFDLQYFIDRIYALGASPADIMCNPSWEVSIVKNFIDFQHENDLAERGDYAVISGYPVWIDQMIQFASRRKAKIGSFTSFKLDDIGQLVAKVKKLDYHHITNNIAMLPYLDFLTFFLYNIMDVIVQECIEVKNQDIEYLFAKSIMNSTIYRKAHRQTTYLINRMTMEFYKRGFIIGNNTNRWNDKPEPFLGAIVGNPALTNGYSKIYIDGRPIWVANNLVDFD